MKNKTVAGILALVAGYMGLHRFYLGQVGLGVGYIMLLPIFLVTGLWFFLFIGLIDAIALFSMDQGAFNAKYNKHLEGNEGSFKNRNERRKQNRNEVYEDRNSGRNSEVAPKRNGPPKQHPHRKVQQDTFQAYD